jgi:methionyl-tRNA synthetase
MIENKSPLHRHRLIQTCALAYANGDLHAGHLVEAIQADAFARHRRARGDDVLFLGADDCHGTPAEIYAASLGLTPEAMIEVVGRAHRADYERFDIGFTAYHKTDSEENHRLCTYVFERMLSGGHIARKEKEQLFDAPAGRFLSDRHVKGSCPFCGSAEQYGDHCEVCGASYEAVELVSPRSTFSGTAPILRKSEHLYFQLEPFREHLLAWIEAGGVHPSVAAKLKEWFDAGLDDWCISRDGPYFGFPIPGEPGKYFYVWVDAPLGYIAALEHHLAEKREETWLDHWAEGSSTEIIHFIGKDITSFHGIFWPAMLKAAGCRPPTRVHAHGFLTVNGAKMSKSRGTFVLAREIADRIDSDAFRYDVLSRLGPGIGDIDFSPTALVDKVNADLVGKFANIATRLRPLLHKASGGILSDQLDDLKGYEELLGQAELVLADFESHDTAAAIRRIGTMAVAVNRTIDDAAPWVIEDQRIVRQICTRALIHFRAIMILLQPIVPRLAHKSLTVFGPLAVGQQLPWASLRDMPLGQQVAIPERIRERLSQASIATLGETS